MKNEKSQNTTDIERHTRKFRALYSPATDHKTLVLPAKLFQTLAPKLPRTECSEIEWQPIKNKIQPFKKYSKFFFIWS